MVNILPAAPLGTTDQMSPNRAAVPSQSSNALNCLGVSLAAQETYGYVAQYYGSNVPDGSVGNAFQHTVWMLRSSWFTSREFALTVGYLHEMPLWHPPLNQAYRNHQTMDFANNGHGVNLASPSVLAGTKANLNSYNFYISVVANDGEYNANGAWTNPSKMWFWVK